MRSVSFIANFGIGLVVFSLFKSISARRIQPKENLAVLAESTNTTHDESATTLYQSTSAPNQTNLQKLRSIIQPPEKTLSQLATLLLRTRKKTGELQSKDGTTPTPPMKKPRPGILKLPNGSVPRDKLLTQLFPWENWNKSGDATMNLDEAGVRDPFGSLAVNMKKWVSVAGLHVCIVAFLCLVFIVAMLIRRASRPRRKQFKHRGRLIYEWDQSDTKMFMYVPLPESIDEENLDIRISPRHLRIARSGKPPFIKDELYLSVDEEESAWKINKGRELEICLVKVEASLWPCVLVPHLVKT